MPWAGAVKNEIITLSICPNDVKVAGWVGQTLKLYGELVLKEKQNKSNKNISRIAQTVLKQTSVISLACGMSIW